MTHAALSALALSALVLTGCQRDATVPEDQADNATMIEVGEDPGVGRLSSPGGPGASLDDADMADWNTYGEPVSADAGPAQRVDVNELLADPAAYAGRDVQVVGEVAEVCQSSGCWVRLADDESPEAGKTVFVKFTCPVEGFLIPKESVGRPASVRGQVVVEQMPEDEARHMAEDAGKSAEEVAAIVGPQTTVRVMSPVARVAM